MPTPICQAMRWKLGARWGDRKCSPCFQELLGPPGRYGEPAMCWTHSGHPNRETKRQGDMLWPCGWARGLYRKGLCHQTDQKNTEGNKAEYSCLTVRLVRVFNMLTYNTNLQERIEMQYFPKLMHCQALSLRNSFLQIYFRLAEPSISLRY